MFNAQMQKHHYLAYSQPVGEHLKYMVFVGGRPIAYMAWSSAPRHLGSRDRFIGWDKQARLKNIALLAYNTRFLILPWVKVPHLASHLLGRIARRLSADWQSAYGHPITSWRPSSIRSAFAARATARRTGLDGRDDGRGKDAPDVRADPLDQAGAGLPAGQELPPAAVACAGGRVKEPEFVTATQQELDEILLRAKPALLEQQYRLLEGVLTTFVFEMLKLQHAKTTSARR
ncbi:Druantia anti-phage system protein DruA [Variovorax humicola]|uniref:Druantia anti-phage system protein DruA n=1 Tax=Variovorax humicola TaxID=1769758 RepID=A0ABU8WAI2_9BURK